MEKAKEAKKKTIDTNSLRLLNCKEYIETYYYIKLKEGGVIKFKLNEPQQKIYNAIKEESKKQKPIRIIIPKARQMGVSTLIEAIMMYNTSTRFGVKTGIIAHVGEATNNLYDMSKLYYNLLPDAIKPSLLASNAKELIFDKRGNKGLGSRITCMTAEGSGVGRSYTFQYLHMSEYAYWGDKKKEIKAGLMAAVPSIPGTMVIIESTGNGFDDFRDLCYEAQSGNSEWRLIFLAWHEMESYRKPYNGLELTSKEIELKKLYKLDNEQIAWRRYTIATDCGGDESLFNQEYPSCLEDCFVSSGNCPFDKTNIISQINVASEPVMRGEFVFNCQENGKKIIDSTIHFVSRNDGPIMIYKDVERGRPYVLSGDTAGEGSDYFASHVLDNITGEQVAVYHYQYDEDYFTNQMYCLGKYYNNALIGIESNFTTYPIKILDEILGYKKLFYREAEDTYESNYKKSYGFRTTSITKPLIIQMLASVTRDNIGLINDKATLKEMLEFIKDSNGKYHAIEGKHDDLVMSLAIAYYIRSTGQQTIKVSIDNNNDELNYVEKMLQQNVKKKGKWVSW